LDTKGEHEPNSESWINTPEGNKRLQADKNELVATMTDHIAQKFAHIIVQGVVAPKVKLALNNIVSGFKIFNNGKALEQLGEIRAARNQPTGTIWYVRSDSTRSENSEEGRNVVRNVVNSTNPQLSVAANGLGRRIDVYDDVDGSRPRLLTSVGANYGTFQPPIRLGVSLSESKENVEFNPVVKTGSGKLIQVSINDSRPNGSSNKFGGSGLTESILLQAGANMESNMSMLVNLEAEIKRLY
jgi:hypothetical protein